MPFGIEPVPAKVTKQDLLSVTQAAAGSTDWRAKK